MSISQHTVNGLLVDLDGTVYRGEALVDRDVPEFFRRATKHGLPFLFVTNRAHRTPETVAAQLRSLGIEVGAERVFTSAMATAKHLKPGRVYAIGEAGLLEALKAHGFEFTEDRPDYVVVGFDRGLTYQKIDTASRLIRDGARFVATNTDALVAATLDRDEAGNGAAVAAISLACGVDPLVVGKPNRIIFEQAILRLGCETLPPSSLWMIGDNPNTDVQGAIDAGLQAVWYNPQGKPADPAKIPEQQTRIHTVHNYRELSDLIFGPAMKK